MKVLVKNLLPNPHRRIQEYEIQADRVQMLMNSINETFFWDNLIARPAPNNSGKYEIAYGHHRLDALQKLKITEIDIHIKDLDDNTMLKIMADENAEEYSMSPSVLNETVLSVKQFLETEIKNKEWEVLPQLWQNLFGSEHGFKIIQGKGIGSRTIRRFLGPNWSLKRIDEALASLRENEDVFDRKAAEQMPSIHASTAFRKAVKDYNIPKPKQKEIAKKLANKKASAREVVREVRRSAPLPKQPKKDPLLSKLDKDLERIEGKTISLSNNIAGFNAMAKELGAKEIKGLAALFQISAMNDLLKQVKEYLTLFGYDYKKIQIGGK